MAIKPIEPGWAAILLTAALPLSSAHAQQEAPHEAALRAAIHPVTTLAEARAWLARVPVTRDFPPDFDGVMRGQAPLFVIEMSTAPGCIACADLWAKLLALRARYGWQARTLNAQEAMLRSGRLGLPWVGNPVVWVRAVADPNRMVPVAIGTDHSANLARNSYLAAKMLTGVRVAVGVRAMSKFTGIVSLVR
ncbi:hypothetical protein [Novosphingobium sp. 1748]|uniref:hypothetical protein n=1 Tax=Novosphingobium sp. 1748 TaxID=2817760 RepID=UPI00286B69A4|nr:hypothetical protein [Novosphingobium sp. 1748]